MGGRGKTPVVAYLARTLVAQGERPAILSRGYGRRRVEDGVVIVSDGVHLRADVDRAGDEPLLLARAVPGAAVLVCDQRAVAATLARRVLGATILLLDDGFQHVSVARDLDIVVIAPEDLRGRRLPFGVLRESPSALRRADAVIVDGDLADADRRKIQAPVFSLRRSIGPPAPLEERHAAPEPGAAVVALAGISRPVRFSHSLETAGWRVARLVSFRDHHRYTARDLAALAGAVRETGAQGVLTTEKDAIRLLPLRPLPVAVAVVPLDARIDPPPAFDQWFATRLQELRS